MTLVGEDAFSGCSNLTSVTLNCKKIGTWFSSYSKIKEIVIGDEVTTIDGYAFRGCSGLTSLYVPIHIHHSSKSGTSGNVL